MKKVLQLLNKYKIETVIIVLLFILFSVPFPAFHSSILGKSVLIALILSLSYFNKICGLLAIIVLVILYQSKTNAFYYYSPYEGFSGTSTSTPTSTSSDSNTVKPDKDHPLANLIQDKMDDNNIKKLLIAKEKHSMNPPPPVDTSSNTITTDTTTGQEGFDLLGTEDTLRKGRQSNTISVKKNVKSDYSLLPFENTKYTENFLIL